MTICRSDITLVGVICVCCLVLSGCSASPRFATKGHSQQPGNPQPAKVEESNSDEPKTSRNPTGKILLTLEGVASYYADEFHGRQTSNGEIYDMHSLTAAHRTFPFGTKVRVTNLENNLSVVVRVNDRGPFKEGRIIDITLAAAKELDMIKHGTARVKLEVLEWGTGQ